MRIEAVHTPEGLVVRRIYPTGEDAWRWQGNGVWTHCLGHKGPWVGVNGIFVPAEVLRACVEAQAAADDTTRQLRSPSPGKPPHARNA